MLLLFQTLYLRNITYEALESKGYRWKMTLLIHPIELFWICGNFQKKKKKRKINSHFCQFTSATINWSFLSGICTPPQSPPPHPTDAIFLWMISSDTDTLLVQTELVNRYHNDRFRFALCYFTQCSVKNKGGGM